MIRDFDALPAYLAAREAMPFSWDGTDPAGQECLRFVMDAVLAQIPGRADPMAAVRGRYRTREEAEAIVREEYGSLRKLVRSGLKGVRPSFAHRGDVAMVDGPDGPTLGLVDVDSVICLAGPEGSAGFVRFDRTAIKAAWSAI